jgi:hypothetical protein
MSTVRLPDIRSGQGRIYIQNDGRFASQVSGYLAGYVRDAELFKDHAGAGLL